MGIEVDTVSVHNHDPGRVAFQVSQDADSTQPAAVIGGDATVSGNVKTAKSVILSKITTVPGASPNGFTVYTADGLSLLGVGSDGSAVAVGRPAPSRFDVTDYGARGDGVHDDTAGIQAAINAAVAWAQAHSFLAEVYFPVPRAWYQISGPLVSGGATATNCQLTLPVIDVHANKVTLWLHGARDASAVPHWQQTTRQINGVLLKSSATSASPSGGNEPAVIGGPNPFNGYGTSATLYSNMLVVVDGIQTMVPNTARGADISGFDFRGVAELRVVSAAALVDGYPTGMTVGSVSGWAFGLATPTPGNNDVNIVESFSCEGYSLGLVLGEHATVLSCRMIYCYIGLAVVGTFWGSAGALHVVTVLNASLEACSVHLMLIGQGARIWAVIDCEDATVTITDQGVAAPSTGTVWIAGGFTNLVLPAAVSNVKFINTNQPVGSVTAPSVPLTTVAYQNAFAREAAVTVTGGTVTAIAVDGTATGVTSGTVIVPAGKNITLTYSAAPTWVWVLF